MFMLVEFTPRNKRTITRTEIVEIPEIRTKNLTDQESTFCEGVAKSLCNKGERVSGWKLLEAYELKKEEVR